MEQERLVGEARLIEGSANPSKKEVELDIIVEGFGNKRDNHYYGREILETAAPLFEGAKMYVDHLDPETIKKLNGNPRKVSDLGGRIVETWTHTTDEGSLVVRGRAKIAQNWLWEMIENDPELLGVSINAWGKSKTGTVEGRQARIVEGISKVGSVDWVTEAGAGGKVVSLVEAQLNEEDTMDGEQAVADLTVEQLTEERPDLVSELLQMLTESDDGEDEEYVAEPDDDDDEHDEPYDTEQQETEDVEYVSEAELEEMALALAQDKLEEAVAAAISVVREQYEAQLLEMQAAHEADLAQRDQRLIAARMIEKAGFKPPTEKALKAEFHDAYFEGEYDNEGNELKSPEDALAEAVTAAINAKREELSVYTEARVTGAGESESLTEAATHTRRRRGPSVDKSIDAELGIS